MNGENRPPLPYGLIESVEVGVQDFKEITHHSRGIHGIYLKCIKKKSSKTSTQHVTGSHGNTRVLTDFAHQSPGRLLCMYVCIYVSQYHILCVYFKKPGSSLSIGHHYCDCSEGLRSTKSMPSWQALIAPHKEVY